uniref:(northern house mosquito) hypothetical protein n=1 Tax=Culex pipiens TaxID=7175 RepID=A0A8D8CXE2_CULPI
MMKTLLKIKYTMPYIAYLVEKFPNMVIEKSEISGLIESFCKSDLHASHLERLIKAMANNKDFNIFEEIVSIMMNKEDLSREVMEVVFQNIFHIDQFLREIKKNLQSKPSARIIKSTRKVLETLNGTIRQLLYSSSYFEAEKIVELEVMNSIYNHALEFKIEEINDCYLYAAKVKNFRGVEEKKNKQFEIAKELFQQALIFLSKVKNPNTRQKLLVLSRSSYTKQLLHQHEEAFHGFEQLYKEIVKFSLSLNNLPEKGVYEASVYSLVEKSNHYKELLESSLDNRKYLNIFGIRSSMAFVLELQGNYQGAIDVYQEFYNVQHSLENSKLRISRSLRNIAQMNKLLGDVYLKDMQYPEARKCYIDTLVAAGKLLNFNKKVRGRIHPMNLEISKFTSRILGSVRYSFLKQAKIEADKETKQFLFDKSEIILKECIKNSLYKMDRWKDIINRKIPQYEGEKKANIKFY